MEAVLDEIVLKDGQLENGFVIDNDEKAEWALRRIRSRNLERDRIVETALRIAQKYQNVAESEQTKAASETDYLQALLHRYFDTVERKATKTQETYRLPTGKLKYKLPSVKMVPDNAKLIKAFPSFVIQEPKLQWAELKKKLFIADGMVIDTETGETVTGVSLENVPGSFSVEA